MLAVPFQKSLEPRRALPSDLTAVAFALFNYLLFLGIALMLNRKGAYERASAALGAANGLTHVLVAFTVLRSVTLWHAPAVTLWLPIAGWLTTIGVWIAARQRGTATATPLTLSVVAQLLPLCALLLFPTVAADTTLSWLYGMEFVLISATWLAIRDFVAHFEFRYRAGVVFGNATVFFGLIAPVLGMQTVHGVVLLAVWAIAMAAYHAVIGSMVLRRPGDQPLDRLLYQGISLTFVTIAIPLQLRAATITFAWAVEAAVLLWTAKAVGEARVRQYGLALLALAAGKALLQDAGLHPVPFHLFINARMFAGASVIVAAYVAAWLTPPAAVFGSVNTTNSRSALIVGASCLMLLFVSLDLWDGIGLYWYGTALASIRQCVLSLFWCVCALAHCSYGMRPYSRVVRTFAIGLLGITALKAVCVDLFIVQESSLFIANPRLLAGAAVVAVAYGFAWLYNRHRAELPETERGLLPVLLVGANLLTLIFISVDLWVYAGQHWPQSGQANAQQLALSVFWAVYALAAVSIGIWQRLRPVRLFAMGLLYVSILKAFLYDLNGLQGIYRIASFFVLGIILLVVSLLYTRFEERMRPTAALSSNTPGD